LRAGELVVVGEARRKNGPGIANIYEWRGFTPRGDGFIGTQQSQNRGTVGPMEPPPDGMKEVR
jgi:hypothetical protein